MRGSTSTWRTRKRKERKQNKKIIRSQEGSPEETGAPAARAEAGLEIPIVIDTPVVEKPETGSKVDPSSGSKESRKRDEGDEIDRKGTKRKQQQQQTKSEEISF